MEKMQAIFDSLFAEAKKQVQGISSLDGFSFFINGIVCPFVKGTFSTWVLNCNGKLILFHEEEHLSMEEICRRFARTSLYALPIS